MDGQPNTAIPTCHPECMSWATLHHPHYCYFWKLELWEVSYLSKVESVAELEK